MYASNFSWRTATTVLFFISFLVSMDSFAQERMIHFPKDSYHTNQILPRLSKEKINVCDLLIGKKYMLSLNPERFTTPCGRYAINDEKSTIEFTATTECQSFSLERSGCTNENSIENTYFSIGCMDCHLKEGEEKSAGSIQTDQNTSVEELIGDIFQGSNCFEIIPSSITYTGKIGSFSNGESSISMEEGIIMATRDISYAQGPNSTAGLFGLPGFSVTPDEDLRAIGGTGIYDKAVIEFDFIPSGLFFSFVYAFASEEYCEWIDQGVNDAFGFFLSGPGINGPFSNNAVNIATLPNGTPVSIDDINWNSNGNFYRSNVPNSQWDPRCSNQEINSPPFALDDIEFDGFTVPLLATYQVEPCQVYHIKLAIGDVGDNAFDSAVFLKANSFNAGGEIELTADISNAISAEDFQISESCSTGEVLVTFDRSGNDNIDEDFYVGVTFGGSATNNIDYTTNFQSLIIIPAGIASITYPISVINDNLIEGTENIIIQLETSCNCDEQPFIEIEIIESPPLQVALDTVQLCAGEEYTFIPDIIGGQPNFIYEWSDAPFGEQMTVSPDETTSYSVTISDICGDVVEAIGIVEIVDAPEAMLSGGASLCNENPETTIQFDFTGIGPWEFTYSIDGIIQPPIISEDPIYTIDTGTPGTYELASVNAGCFGNALGVAQIDFTSLELNSNVVDVTCFGENSGAINLTINGGTAPYSYEWSDGTSTENIENIPDGSYQVTVTDMNGCTSETAATIATATELETMAVETQGVDCQNPEDGAINLTVNGGTAPYSYEWNNGAVDEDPSSLVAGEYDVIVTDANGCTSEASASVSANQELPDADGVALGEVNCISSMVAISGDGSSEGTDITYSWSSTSGQIIEGGTTLNPTVDGAGIYELVVLDASNGCTSVAFVTVDENLTPPEAELTDALPLTCDITEVMLTATIEDEDANSYQWITSNGNIINGNDGLTPSVNQPGIYELIVTDNENGCTEQYELQVSEDITPPIANAGNPFTLNCTTTELNLDGSASSNGDNYTIEWTTSDGNIIEGVDSDSPIIDAAGTYEIIITNTENGCSETASTTVNLDNELPIANAGNDGTLSCTELTISLDGNGSSQGGTFEYEWNGPTGSILSGGNSLTPEVSAAGTYTLLVTNTANGCTEEAEVNIGENTESPIALVAEPDILNCNQETLILNGNGSSEGTEFSYSWTTTNGTFISGENTLTPEINAPGSYELIIENTNNGCVTTALIEVSQDNELPLAEAIVPDVLNCINNTITINGENSTIGENITYTWTTSDGNISEGMNETSPIVDAAGTYTLLVSNTENGCTQITIVEVDANLDIPLANAGDNQQLSCTESTTTLDGVGSSTGSIFEYEWSGPIGSIVSGGNSLSPEISAAGTYDLLVTNTENGCTEMASVDIAENTESPVVVIAEPAILNCEISSLILSADGSSEGTEFVYTWTTSNGVLTTGENTLTPEISGPGSYELLIENTENGCLTAALIEVEEDVELPIADANVNDLLSCVNEIIIINTENSSTGDQFTYNWITSDGNILNGSETLSPEVNAPGTYELLITNTENQCSTSTEVEVAVDENTPFAAIEDPLSLTCAIQSLEINALNSSIGPLFTYQWTTPNGNITQGDNTLTPSINMPGTYELFIENTDNGCTSEAMIIVEENTEFPIADAGPNTILNCVTTSFELDATNSSTGEEFIYNWTTDIGNIIQGTNSLNPIVDATGTYVLSVLNTENGCETIHELFIDQDIEIPAVEAGVNGFIDCEITSVELEGIASQNSMFSLEWMTPNGNILSGENTLNPEVNAPGIYTLTITNNENGCTNSDEATVTQDADIPIAAIAPSDNLDCAIEEIQINASESSTGSTLVYQWTSSDGNIISGSDGLMPTINSPGLYELVIEDLSNGCSTISTIQVDQDIVLPTVTIESSAVLNCTTTTLNLDASNSSQGDEFDYSWTSPDGNEIGGMNSPQPEISSPGTYVLTILNQANQCSNTEEITVLQDIVTPATVIAPAPMLNCGITEVAIDASESDDGSDFIYEWTSSNGNIIEGENSLVPTINEPGIYELLITNTENGCTSTEQIGVEQNIELPIAAIQDPAILTCAVNTINIDANNSSIGNQFDYQWTSPNGNIIEGANSLSPLIDEAGTYTISIFNNDNLCNSSAEITVTQDIEAPIADAGSDDQLNCVINDLQLDGSNSSQGNIYTYEWMSENGNIIEGNTLLNPTIQSPGQYQLIVTNIENGCTTIDQVQIIADDLAPLASIANPQELNCIITDINLNGNAVGGSNLMFEWASPNGNILSDPTQADIDIDAPGIYELLVTDLENGCATIASVEVSQDITLPEVEAGQGGELTCSVTSFTLQASASEGIDFQYFWSTSGGNILSGINTLNPVVDAQGQYSLTILNTLNGCESTDELEITLNENIPVGIDAFVEPPLCHGDPGAIFVNTIVGGVGPYQYSIDNGTTYGGETIFNDLETGFYNIQILDGNGCELDTSLQVPFVPEVEVDINPEVELTLGENFTMVPVTNIPADDIAEIIWTPADGLSCTNCLNPILTPIDDINYQVTIINNNGCQADAQIQFRVDRDKRIFIPNAFSPHRVDGTNDKFIIYALEGSVKEIRMMQIYDRWGSKLWENAGFLPNDPAEGWDGIFLNKKMNPAVFVYWAEVEFIDGTVKLYKGDFTLLD